MKHSTPALATPLLSAAALTALAIGVAGCQSQGSASRPLARPATPSSAAATTQPGNPNAYLPLDQIQPVPRLAPPATQPAGEPPLAALRAYAQARDAMLMGERFTAITQLEKTVALDPHSFDAWYDLGRSYLSVANMEDKAIDALEHAAALEPDHLDVQVQLGRLYLAKGDTRAALRHLRLALQTQDYNDDGDNAGQAAVADLLLARTLEQAGYDRAALDRYNLLLQRLHDQAAELRHDPELGFLIDRPELLYGEIGQLYERHGAYAQALQAEQLAASRDPNNMELQARIAKLLALLGRRDDALAAAANVVARTGASPDSLALLADVCRQLNESGGVTAALRKLHHDRPDDRPVLLALCDALVAQGRPAEAEQLLTAAWRRKPSDVPLARRIVTLRQAQGNVVGAADVLVEALAQAPDALPELATMWEPLLRPSQPNHLTVSGVRSLNVPPQDRAAKLFWAARLAEEFHRDVPARADLQQAVALQPPFAPAYRELLNAIWRRDEWSDQQKIDASQQLAEQAAAGGDQALADELHGLSLLNQKTPAAAADALGAALHAHGADAASADLLLEYANARRSPGHDPAFEQTMWKLISDHPLFDPAYAALFSYYASNDVANFDAALKVLATWLSSNPSSVAARVLAIGVEARNAPAGGAENRLLRLFDEAPDNPDVLDALEAADAQAGRLDAFESRLQDYLNHHPDDVDVATRLASTYLQQKRPADAKRVVDATRSAVQSDADLLYDVAQLYSALGDKAETEDTLQQVVKLDPTNSGAENDLGFQWADEGKNLPQAESMVRAAVTAEPGNNAFLDSLGWVLYKEGKFDQARQYLEKAAQPTSTPADPVILDHLGDTLYRLAQPQKAADLWQHSLTNIGPGEPDREDLRQLRGQLQQKLKQLAEKKPVDVAPVAK